MLASQIQQFLTVFTIGLIFWHDFGGTSEFREWGGVCLNPPPPPSLRHCLANNFDVCVRCLFADYKSSKLFGDAPKDILDILESQDVTANFHHFCVTEGVSNVIFLENKIMDHMVGHPRCVFINYFGLINCRTQLICGRYMFIT